MNRDYRPGDILRYPYLWRWQHDREETEGRKDRPVCIVIAVSGPRDGMTHLALLAISSQPPGGDGRAIEVSEIECRRGGLSDLKRAWVTVSEYNYDIAERSHYIDPGQPALGRFSKQFTMKLAAAFAETLRAGRGRIVRSE